MLFSHAEPLEIQKLQNLLLFDDLLSRTTLTKSQGTLRKGKRATLQQLHGVHIALERLLALASTGGQLRFQSFLIARLLDLPTCLGGILSSYASRG
jgi:hypothetical protein